MANGLTPELLTQLAALPVDQALAALAERQLLSTSAALQASHLALATAAAQPAEVARWLTLIEALLAATDDDPSAGAAYAYAQSRLALEQGELPAAEDALQRARSLWQQTGDELSLGRSGMGLTQLLAMQGRFDEAETVVGASIRTLTALPGDEAALLQRDARQTLATLLSYQERHAEALAITSALRAEYLEQLAQADHPSDAAELQMRIGLVERDIALAQTYLDQSQAAEGLLAGAVERLSLPESRIDRGQTRTNLGHLYNRTGRYAQAVAELDAAAFDLFGTLDVDSVPELWPAADLLFLEQAATYLALNLLPEAETALRRAIEILRPTEQSYELGQALQLLGLLEWQRGNLPATDAALAEAQTIFEQLGNLYWLHRIALAQAAVALRRDAYDEAARRIDALLDDVQRGEKTRPLASVEGEDAAVQAGPVTWDQAGACELHLLDTRLGLATGDLQRADRGVNAAAAALGLVSPREGDTALQHLHIQVLHAAGQLARAEGRIDAARTLFVDALEKVEAQRGMLPIEELRTAFLADKSAIYEDMVLSLLDAPEADGTTISDAFAVVERARSRALLERLLTSVDDVEAGADLPPEVREQLATTRRRLYWLYNQLLGGESGSRGLSVALSSELRAHEATLQRLEWQTSPWLQQAQPVTLFNLQSSLAVDQAAVVYFVAGDELMAFVVAADQAQVVRNVTTVSALDDVLAQLRFQLGRVEIGANYLARHETRLLEGARAALHRLYRLLIAPLHAHLAAVAPQRLLVIPYGPLHLAPFHALWDGRQYLLESYEISYAASASLAVRRPGSNGDLCSLAGLALRDEAIPQAENEVRSAADHFGQVQLFLDEEAGLAGLWEAAQSGDVLHIATHGVFRPDNPFFSALKLADGWIDVRTIYRLPLSARLVVLSACESGAVQVQGSDEAIGLARGFLGAGAESLVVSLWNVHDASAAQLMDQFYAQLTTQNQRPAAALRAVQCEAARSNRHPYYWAPYVVMGDAS
jgi:CHAT domain-containing protein/tetratricopeptide (TPR) repeat protein